jgi:phosphomannomutase
MEQYLRACKAYDLRWVYTKDIDERMMYWLWVHLAKHIRDISGTNEPVVIWSDVRWANNTLVYRLIRWLESAWIDQIVLLGRAVEGDGDPLWWWVTSTSVFYHVAAAMKSFGVQCTASHNPPEYVGMKIVGPDGHLLNTDLIRTWLLGTSPEWRTHNIPALELPSEDEIFRIHQNYASSSDTTPYWAMLDVWEMPFSPVVAQVNSILEAMYAWMDQLFSTLPSTVTFVVDYSQWAWVGYERAMIHSIVDRYGHNLIELWYRADGNFSLHASDTTDYASYHHLQEAVLMHKADFGLLFDGDADRIGLVDNEGAVVPGDVLVAWFVEILGSRWDMNWWGVIIYDVGSTQAIVDIANRYKIEAISSKIWQRFLKEKFHQHHAFFAGELSGHLFFSETGGHEFVMYALYVIMLGFCSLWVHERLLSTHIAWLMPYAKTSLRNVHVENTGVVLDRFRQLCYDIPWVTLDETDGIKAFTDRGWVLVRASNTEPVVRICAEWTSLADADALVAWVLSIV